MDNKQPTAVGGGGFTDFANGMKTLSSIKFSDFIAISVIPLNGIARNIRNFYKTIGTIKKSDRDSAVQSIEAFTKLIQFIDKENPVKMWAKLVLFPTKQTNKFIDDLSLINKSIKEYAKETLSEKELDSIKRSMDSFMVIRKTLEKFGLSDVIKMKMSALAISSTAIVIAGITKLGKETVSVYTPDFGKKINSSAKVMNAFVSDMNHLTLRMAAIGLFSPILLPTALLGIGLYYVVTKLTGSLANSVILSSKKTIAAKKAIKNMLLFAGAAALLTLTIAASGMLMLSIGGLKAIGIGIVLMATGMLGIFGLVKLSRFVGDTAGSNKTKGAFIDIFSFLGASVLVSIAIISVGALMNRFGGWKALTLGATLIAGSMGILWGLSLLARFTGKQTKRALPSFKNLLMFVGASILLSVGIIAIGVITKALGGWPVALMGLSIVGGSLLALMGLSILTKTVGESAKKAFLPMLGIIALGGLMELLAYGMVKLGKAVDKAGGWKTIGNALGVVAATIGEMTVITLAIGGLMMIPFLPLVMGAGIATITGLGVAFLAITDVAKNMVELGKSVTPEEIKSSSNTTSAFVDAMTNMIGKFKSISVKSILKATASLVPIRSLISSMSMFVKILRDFAGEPGYLKVQTGVDKDGNPVYDRQGVNIKEASESIANGFGTFIKITFAAIKDAQAKSVSFKAVRRINQLMDPVSKFANILTAFTTDKDGTISIARYDENGNLIKGQVVDIEKIGLSLGNGFGTFINKIFERMDVVEENMVSRKTIKRINNLMLPVTTFVDIVSMFESSDGKLKKVITDENGNITETREVDIVAIGNSIATSFESFVTVVTNALNNVAELNTDGAKSNVKMLKQLTAGISEFAQELESSFSTDDELNKFKKNSEEINKTLGELAKLYQTKLDDSLGKSVPKLKKNHHDFMYALEKDTKGIKKPLQDYIKAIKELNEQYNKLTTHLDKVNKNHVTLVLENGPKYETKMTDDVADKFAENYGEKISPILKDTIKDVINSITANASYNGQQPKGTISKLNFGTI
jgi:hypothetical protein